MGGPHDGLKTRHPRGACLPPARPYDPYGAKLSWWQRFWKWLESDATPWQRCTLVVPADSLEEAGRQLADRRSRRSQVPRPDAVSYDEVWSGLVFSDWA